MVKSKHDRQKNKRTYLSGVSKSRTLSRRIEKARSSKSQGKPKECMDRVMKRVREKHPDLFGVD
jgi:hypothetical protein